LLLTAGAANAAKIALDVLTPRLQIDPNTRVESPIDQLQSIRIEWGTCTASSFTRQAAIDYPESRPGVSIRVYAYPTGLSRVCMRTYAIAHGVLSDPSNAVVETLSSPLGKPVTLGQPVLLPPAP
jgi:hypothetical protein